MSDDLSWLPERIRRCVSAERRDRAGLAHRVAEFRHAQQVDMRQAPVRWHAPSSRFASFIPIRLGRWQRFCAWFRRSKVPMARTVRR